MIFFFFFSLFLFFVFLLENMELKRKLEQLTAKYERLDKKTSREIERLRDENKFLAEINDAFGKENDELQEQLDRYVKYRLPRSLQRKTGDGPSVKATKSKGKKPIRCSDDELEQSNFEGNRTDYEESNEKGDRVCCGSILLWFFSKFS